MHPGKVGERIALTVEVTYPGELLVGCVRNLVVVPAERGHHPQLVARIDVENQGPEPPEAARAIVDNGACRREKTKVSAVTVQAGVVGETFGMASEADLVVGLVEAAVAADPLAFVRALEAGARHDIEHAVGAVAVFGRVAAAPDLDVINVFGIELRTDVARNIGVGHRHAVDQPTDLVAPADVKLIVHQGGSRHIVGDHRQAVGAVGPWGA